MVMETRPNKDTAPVKVRGWSGYRLDDGIRALIAMGCPLEFTKERDELAGNGSGADLYTLKWITPVKDADGKGR